MLACLAALPVLAGQARAEGGSQEAARAGSGARAAQAHAPLIVIELFTSQGCSSCPPADALLKTYLDRPGILALSMPVDYWDHLGWKDTLANPKNTARQRSYAKSLGTGNVYTPQAVINGTFQAVGSKKYEIDKALALASKQSPPVSLTAVSDQKRVTIEVGSLGGTTHAAGSGPAGASPVAATVWLAIVTSRAEVEIKRGENRGKMLTYNNVVRDISPIGMWDGKPMKIELPLSAVQQPGDRCAVLLQADEGGRILSAVWMTP